MPILIANILVSQLLIGELIRYKYYYVFHQVETENSPEDDNDEKDEETPKSAMKRVDSTKSTRSAKSAKSVVWSTAGSDKELIEEESEPKESLCARIIAGKYIHTYIRFTFFVKSQRS